MSLVFIINSNPLYHFLARKYGSNKGLGVAGYTMETVKTGLKLAVRAYPSYFYTHFARAEVLYQTDRKDAAKAILQHSSHYSCIIPLTAAANYFNCRYDSFVTT